LLVAAALGQGERRGFTLGTAGLDTRVIGSTAKTFSDLSLCLAAAFFRCVEDARRTSYLFFLSRSSSRDYSSPYHSIPDQRRVIRCGLASDQRWTDFHLAAAPRGTAAPALALLVAHRHRSPRPSSSLLAISSSFLSLSLLITLSPFLTFSFLPLSLSGPECIPASRRARVSISLSSATLHPVSSFHLDHRRRCPSLATLPLSFRSLFPFPRDFLLFRARTHRSRTKLFTELSYKYGIVVHWFHIIHILLTV